MFHWYFTSINFFYSIFLPITILCSNDIQWRCEMLNLYVRDTAVEWQKYRREENGLGVFNMKSWYIVRTWERNFRKNIAVLAFFCFFPVRRVVVKLNVPCVIRWHNTEIPQKSIQNSFTLSRLDITRQFHVRSGTCFGITKFVEVQQSRISIIESISRLPIIGENPEA